MSTHPAVPLAVAEPARRRLGIFTTADLGERGVSKEDAPAIEFDGRVEYRRPQYGRTPEDEQLRPG